MQTRIEIEDLRRLLHAATYLNALQRSARVPMDIIDKYTEQIRRSENKTAFEADPEAKLK